MLRSLNVWEVDEAGVIVLDEHGNRVGLKSKRAGLPKTRAEMSAAERRYVDERAVADEESWRLGSARGEIERDALRRAAEAMAAKPTT